MLFTTEESLSRNLKGEKLGLVLGLDDFNNNKKAGQNCAIRPTISAENWPDAFFNEAETSTPKEIDKILNGGSNFKKIGVETMVKKIIDAKLCLSRQHQKCLLDYLTSKSCDESLAKRMFTDLLTAHKFTNCVALELINILIQISSISIIRLFIDTVSDFDEKCAVKIIKYCVREDQEEDENLSIDKQILLRRLFRQQFSMASLTDELKILTARESTILIRILTIFLSNSQIHGDKNGEYADFSQMLNMAGIFLDAFSLNFHRSEEFRQEVKNLEAIVTSSIFMADIFRKRQNSEKMQKLKKDRIKNDYSIEILIL